MASVCHLDGRAQLGKNNCGLIHVAIRGLLASRSIPQWHGPKGGMTHGTPRPEPYIL